jgi:hypothetical protein
MKIWDVRAIAVNRQTGAPHGAERTERVDGNTNPMFMDCMDAAHVHDTYELFWNGLNPQSEDVVLVVGVTEVRA